jgi:clan AA aspartic protease
VKGIVDSELRALIEVSMGNTRGGKKSGIVVWVDTAFNGGLVLPRQVIEELQLKEYSSTSAILADGQQVELPTYTCYLEWFGKEYRTQIIANDGAHPLIGTMLLDGHDLCVSYRRKTVELD